MWSNLATYYFPEQLKEHIGAFIDHYNNHRYHESLDNMTPANVYDDKSKEIKTKKGKPRSEH